MLRTKSFIRVGLLAATVGVWGLLGWRLLLAGGVIPGTLSSSWRDLARRSAWAHWVNGSPTIQDGKAYLKPGEQYEIAVQPFAVCAKLRIATDQPGRVRVVSKDRPETLSTDVGFSTQYLPRTFDGYHFLLTADTEVVLTSFTFTCHP